MKIKDFFGSPEHPQAALWFGRRTEDHFARQLPSLDALKPPVRDAFQKTLQPDECIRILIHAPFQGMIDARDPKKRFWRSFIPWRFSSNWVVALTQSRLLLAQISQGDAPNNLYGISLEDLLCLRSGKILLFSWLEIHWVEQGIAKQKTIYYNTVCEWMFVALLEALRAQWIVARADFRDFSDQNLALLEPLPFKFLNMIPLYLLLPGEPVEKVLYRPAMWKKRFWIFRKMIAPRMALVWTHDHFLFAEEDLSGREGSYGFVATFLPWRHIDSIVLDKTDQDIKLVISLCPNPSGKLVIPFSVDFEGLLQTWQFMSRKTVQEQLL